MEITYHGHSGFSVKTSGPLLVFDYLGEGLGQPEGSVLAFISHAHQDHCHPAVLRWAEEGRARLITGDDVRSAGRAMKPGERIEEEGVVIEAFASTDQGVSFLVRADGKNLFHAGDFNLWHWRWESTAGEIREAEEAFEAALDTLRGRKIDLAFFPVDPRMGEGHEEGATRFARALRPRWLIPMHFWDQPQAAKAMEEKDMPPGVCVHAMTEPGETFIPSI